MTKLKVPVSSEDHVQGPEDARITLVEYGDYECPHCALAHPVVNRLQKHFGKTDSLCLPQLSLDASRIRTPKPPPKPQSSPEHMESSGRCTTCSLKTSRA